MSNVITSVTAHPISFPIPESEQVSLGIGRTIKRDAVLVRVVTDEGVIGWGEAHAARAPTAIAELINTTLASLIIGMPAADIDAVWQRIYRQQLASHGAGAASVIGLSGIDIALWDIKGKIADQPIYKLLGGETRRCESYAGGIALGFSPPSQLADEASELVAAGYPAVKLRLGDKPELDLARVKHVRDQLGAETAVLTDANTAYDWNDFAEVAQALKDFGVGWLEEPFPAHDFQNYRRAKLIDSPPIALGENHYTRFDFERLADDESAQIWQPDLSKTGGLTEGLRIAKLAASHGIRIHPHTSLTNLNMSASLHLLTAIANPGYFEADVSRYNPLRDDFSEQTLRADENGCYAAPSGPGLGISPHSDVLRRFPAIAGPGYVS